MTEADMGNGSAELARGSSGMGASDGKGGVEDIMEVIDGGGQEIEAVISFLLAALMLEWEMMLQRSIRSIRLPRV